MKGRGDEAAVPSTSDAPGTVRTEAHAGSEAAAEQRVPKLARRSPEQSVPAGPLSRRLSKISADPIEILQALENLSEIISERVVREIRAFRREFESRLDVQDAKIDALYKLYDGLRSEINGLRQDLNGLRSQMRLLVALFGLQVVFLGFLVAMGFMDRFSPGRVAASPTSMEVQAAQPEAEESASEMGGAPLASAPTSEDTDQTEVDTAEEREPNLFPAR